MLVNILSEVTMTDKEERTEQFITIQQRTITTRDYETNDEIISKIYPCQEAIEVMAKALCHRHCPEKVCTSCDEWEKYGTKEDAEEALNALLEGVEK